AASTASDPTSVATPMTEAATGPPPASPEVVSSTTATTGSASFANTFQMPASSSASVTGRRPNPHERYIAALSPTPNAAPAGAVFDTAVDACDTCAACQNPSPGRTAISAGWYEARFASATSASVATSSPVMSRIVWSTSP